MTNPTMGGEMSWTDPWRRADIAAANGHGNARSVALAQSAVSCGGEVDGTPGALAAGIERVFVEQANGTDLVLGVPLRIGIGYGLPNETVPLPGERCCFWGGSAARSS